MKKSAPLVIILFVVLAAVASLVAMASVPAAAGLMGAAALGAMVFFRPFSGLILYIIMIYAQFQLIFPALQKLRVMLFLAVLIIVTFIVHKVFRKEPMSIASSRNSILMMLFLGLVFISHIVNLGVAPDWQGVYVVLTVFLLFMIMVNLTTNFDQFRMVCWTLVGCTIALAINGLIMHFRGYDLAGITPILGRIHWVGLFGDPNDYALAINAFIPFILINLFDSSISRQRKMLLLVVSLLLLAAIYYTNSRGGYVALIVILSVFAVKRWGLLKGIVTGVLFIGVALVLAPSRMGNVSPYEASASGRVNAWISGLVMLKGHPLFGVGPANFQAYHIRAAHSAFIQCMSELGFLGYGVWLALIYSSYAGLRAVEKNGSEIYVKYAKILQLSLIGFLSSAVFLSQAYTPVLYIIFALVTLLLRFCEPPVRQNRGFTQKDILFIIAIIGFSIVLYKFLAMVYI